MAKTVLTIDDSKAIRDTKLKRRVIKEGLRPYLFDNVNAWEMQGDGSYKHKAQRGKPRSAQAILLEELSSPTVR